MARRWGNQPYLESLNLVTVMLSIRIEEYLEKGLWEISRSTDLKG